MSDKSELYSITVIDHTTGEKTEYAVYSEVSIQMVEFHLDRYAEEKGDVEMA